MGFQQGLSGLSSSGKALDVTSNNIANASTVGFKSSNTHFADVFGTQMVVGTASPAGIGVNVSGIAQEFTQGTISTTSNPLDLAINGSGFFRVSSVDSVTGEQTSVSYTRNGQFHVDKDGYIVNDQGMSLIGMPTQADGTIPEMNDSLTNAINVFSNDGSPQATTTATLKMNLDADATGDYTRGMTVYDSQGGKCSLNYTFTKSAAVNEWVFTAKLTDAQGRPYDVLASPNSITPSSVNLKFGTDGKLISPTSFDLHFEDGNATVSGISGASPLNITVDTSAITQYKSAFSVDTMTQDGYGKGQLSRLSISEDGVIQALYDTGKTADIGQVALYTFTNPNGLDAIGGNLWIETAASGQPTGNYPGDGNTGDIMSSAVENSNVDLTKELVDMIVMQRNYQASAQTIKTQDQILQTLVNLR